MAVHEHKVMRVVLAAGAEDDGADNFESVRAAGIGEIQVAAQATLRTIKQNLFWAFFYNAAAAVPLTALGFLNPVLCAAVMGLSDVVVIGNALRLRRWKG